MGAKSGDSLGGTRELARRVQIVVQDCERRRKLMEMSESVVPEKTMTKNCAGVLSSHLGNSHTRASETRVLGTWGLQGTSKYRDITKNGALRIGRKERRAKEMASRAKETCTESPDLLYPGSMYRRTTAAKGYLAYFV